MTKRLMAHGKNKELLPSGGNFYKHQKLGKNYFQVFVLKTTSFRGIRLKLTGTLRIKWVEMEAGSAIPFI